MRILLIEDHPRLAQTIIGGLGSYGFGVDLFTTAEEGLLATKSGSYSALILDLGLPDKDGIEVIGELRSSRSRIPVLILTARDGVNDRVAGLDKGADDYLLKPFAMKELAARLRALLRRPGGPLGVVIEVGNVCLDTTVRHLKVDGRVVAIPRREAPATRLLMARGGK